MTGHTKHAKKLFHFRLESGHIASQFLQQITRLKGLTIRNIRMPMRTWVFFKRGELLLALFFLLSLHVRAKEPAAQDLFRDAVIPSLHLQLSSEAVSSLSRSPRKYIKANVREGT